MAALLAPAIGRLQCVELGHCRPKVVDSGAHQGADLKHFGLPETGVVALVAGAAMQAQQAQRRGDLRLCTACRVGVQIGLVDDHQIGNLHHAFFDGLQLVAGIGQLQEHKHVGHARNRGFRLAHADGFDDDDVIARCFAHQHGFAGFFRHAAQRAAAGARADVGLFAHRQQFHARFVAQDGATRHRAGRVDGQHCHAVALANQVQAQRFNEGGLANARHAADPQAQCTAGVRQDLREQFVAVRAVVGAGGFQQRDGFGHCAALLRRAAVQQRMLQCVHGGGRRWMGFLL